jgi:hypothetical protein
VEPTERLQRTETVQDIVGKAPNRRRIRKGYGLPTSGAKEMVWLLDIVMGQSRYVSIISLNMN